MRSLRMSSQRYCRRSTSSTFSSPIWNGSGSERETMRQRVDLHLDLARRHVRVDRLRRAADDLALRLEDELVADLVRDVAASAARSGLMTSCTLPV